MCGDVTGTAQIRTQKGTYYTTYHALLYTLVKHARFCEPGIVTISRRYIIFFVGELVEI